MYNLDNAVSLTRFSKQYQSVQNTIRFNFSHRNKTERVLCLIKVTFNGIKFVLSNQLLLMDLSGAGVRYWAGNAPRVS